MAEVRAESSHPRTVGQHSNRRRIRGVIPDAEAAAEERPDAHRLEEARRRRRRCRTTVLVE